MRPALILWDWNGTLLDDLAHSLACLNRLLKRFGYAQQLSLPRYRSIFGFPVIDYYRRAGMDLQRHPFPLLAQSYMDDYLSGSEACPLAPHAAETLAALHRAGVRQAILSAAPQDTLEAQVSSRGVRPYFEALSGLDNIYAVSKLESGQRLLAGLGLDPARVLLVGDTLHDHEVAQALGVGCLLYAGGHQSRERLAAAGVPVADSLQEVQTLL